MNSQLYSQLGEENKSRQLLLAQLSIDALSSEDNGLYSCRVDFRKSRSRTQETLVKIIGKFAIQARKPLKRTPQLTCRSITHKHTHNHQHNHLASASRAASNQRPERSRVEARQAQHLPAWAAQRRRKTAPRMPNSRRPTRAKSELVERRAAHRRLLRSRLGRLRLSPRATLRQTSRRRPARPTTRGGSDKLQRADCDDDETGQPEQIDKKSAGAGRTDTRTPDG